MKTNIMKGAVRVVTLALAIVAAACSSPDPVLYTIAPVPGATQGAAPAVIVLHTVGLARYLDRPQIVYSSESNRLDVRSNDWWGEPLGAMLGRVLAEELGQRLPQSTVIGENSGVSARSDAVVEIDFRRLDRDASGNLVLVAQASVSFTNRKQPSLRNFRIAVPVGEPGVPAQVRATSAAVGQLADGLAVMLATSR